MSQGTIFDGDGGNGDGGDIFNRVPFDGREYPGNRTIEQGREYVRDTLRRDIRRACPCCGQDVFLYARPLNATMARAIIALYRAGGERHYVHTPSLPGDSHESSQLQWWGLIIPALERRPDGGKAGYWKLTPRGVAYVLDQITLDYHARTFDAHCFWTEGKQWGIQDALKDPFNYRRLMGWDDE